MTLEFFPVCCFTGSTVVATYARHQTVLFVAILVGEK